MHRRCQAAPLHALHTVGHIDELHQHHDVARHVLEAGGDGIAVACPRLLDDPIAEAPHELRRAVGRVAIDDEHLIHHLARHLAQNGLDAPDFVQRRDWRSRHRTLVRKLPRIFAARTNLADVEGLDLLERQPNKGRPWRGDIFAVDPASKIGDDLQEKLNSVAGSHTVSFAERGLL